MNGKQVRFLDTTGRQADRQALLPMHIHRHIQTHSLHIGMALSAFAPCFVKWFLGRRACEQLSGQEVDDAICQHQLTRRVGELSFFTLGFRPQLRLGRRHCWVFPFWSMCFILQQICSHRTWISVRRGETLRQKLNRFFQCYNRVRNVW